MATKEYYIEKVTKAIENLDKKRISLLRHQKALDKYNAKLTAATDSDDIYWIKCDIEHKNESIANTERAIADLENRIADYRTKIEEIEAKEKGRNVAPLIEFLNNWEQDAIEYYQKRYAEYPEARKVFAEEESRRNKEILQMAKDGWKNKSHENYSRYYIARRDRDQFVKKFNSDWKEIEAFIWGKDGFNKAMRTEVECEKWRKYDDIIDRTVKEIGVITDATGLRVNARCNLDGIIKGERGAVNVHTIYAGGYHIQCLHVRTLIHKLK